MKTFRQLLALLMMNVVVLAILALPAGATSPEEDFDKLVADLIRFHDLGLLSGGSGEPVTFDAMGAHAQGFSAEAIKLGQQIADQTNEIVDQLVETNQLAEAGMTTQKQVIMLDTRGRPELQGFLAEATNRRNAQAGTGAQEAETEGAEVEPLGIPGSHFVCGYYPNPKPPRAAPWVNHSSPDPAATLRSWGYHQTPDFAGGGWTRNQTYKPVFCGWGTFRDHAIISGQNIFREQNYTDSPGGEPNPEVWRTGPWPYADWPLYVNWWHQRCNPQCPD